MKKLSEVFWGLIGLAAVAVSCYLLWGQLKTLSWASIEAAFAAIPLHHFLFAAVSTLVAYAALAWYDRIALLHLGVRHISWLFVSLCSFTFGLGTILLGGFVLVYDPNLLARLDNLLPAVLTNPATSRLVGFGLLGFVALYVLGSVLRFRPLTIRNFKIEYPRPGIMVRQLIAAPLELLGAAGIIYFALPDALNPGFIPVLGIFLASFSVALASHAPGGLGVFELVFFTAMQLQTDAEKAPVLAAVLIFRLFYLIIPFAVAIVVVLLFERSRLTNALGKDGKAAPEPPLVAPGLDKHVIERRLEKKAV